MKIELKFENIEQKLNLDFGQTQIISNGERPTLFTPDIMLDEVSGQLLVKDGNGDFPTYDLYIDNKLVGNYKEKTFDISEYAPKEENKTVKIQAVNEFFKKSDFSNEEVWRIGAGTTGLAYELSSTQDYYLCSGIGTAFTSDIKIAREHNGLLVKEVKSNAFSANTEITSLETPASLETIGQNAFNGCKGLKEVNLSYGLKTIGKYAFYECPNIQTLVLPNSLQKIDVFAFCFSLKVDTVVIPDSVVEILNFAFSYTSVKHYIIGNGVTSLIQNSFIFNYGLLDIVVGRGVKRINISVFDHCSKLENLYFHSTQVPTVQGNSFYDINPNCIFHVKKGLLHNPNEDKTIDAQLYYDTATNWSAFTQQYTFLEDID